MTTKASGTLVLIIEKRHAPWDPMIRASSALKLRFCFWCRLRIASARPLVGPSWALVSMSQSGYLSAYRAN